MDFYEILLDIMAEKQLSIPAVATACGLTDSTVRSIITRQQKRVSLDIAFKLKDGLGVSLQRLNGEIEKSPTPTEADTGDKRLDGIIKNYHQLNEEGKDALADQSEIMIHMPKYKKCNSVSEEETEVG